MAKKLEGAFAILLIGTLVCSAVAVDKPTTEQKTCITAECHTDYSKADFVHGPVKLGDCKSCHKAVDASRHTYQPARKGVALCQANCHIDQATKKNVHEPLEKGDCLQCHDPHVGTSKFLLKTETVAGLCNDCHKIGEGMPYMHGPVSVGECSLCHAPHSSEHKSLLTMDPNELCFSCHEVTRDELQKFEFIHEPAKGNCIGCHNPHGGENSKLLKATAPDLCLSCHDKIKHVAENSKHKHSVVVAPGGCLKCHTPHASTIKSNLKKDPASLCMTCHNEAQKISEDEILPSFSDELKDKKFLHGPVQDKNCAGCHAPHGGEHFRLLKQEYPPIFYAPFAEENYELCFGCHERTLVQTAKTDNLTDFRNGYQNLHFLHVNKERRGRTCRACHQTHASNRPKHIRKSVPYGKWELPIGFTKTETGGSCKPGCHLVKDYDRKKPVDYSKPPAAKSPPSAAKSTASAAKSTAPAVKPTPPVAKKVSTEPETTKDESANNDQK